MSIVDAFDGDVRRMLAFAWGIESTNPYPPGIEAGLYKTDLSTEKRTEGEAPPIPVSALEGLSRTERRAQASQIRGAVKRAIDGDSYDLIELRLVVPYDQESEHRKIDACHSVIRTMKRCTTYSEDKITRAALSFGKMSDARVRNAPLRLMNDMFDIALDSIWHRL